MNSTDEKLQACSICGVHEPLHTLTDNVCVECIKDGRIKKPLARNKKTLTRKEKTKEPIPAAFFFWGAAISFTTGLYAILELKQLWGIGLILTVTPCLLLYPIIRFLFFGKDSIGAAITTIVVEEYLKNKLMNAGKNKRDR